jgi:pre-mRNA-processing factor 40
MTIRTAEHLFGDHAEWRAFKSDHDRRFEFDNYISDLRRAEKERARELHQRNLSVFESLIRSIPDINAGTSWSEAKDLYKARPDYQADEDLQKMDLVDCLTMFQTIVLQMERDADEKYRRSKDERFRMERKHRDQFKVRSIHPCRSAFSQLCDSNVFYLFISMLRST